VFFGVLAAPPFPVNFRANGCGSFDFLFSFYVFSFFSTVAWLAGKKLFQGRFAHPPTAAVFNLDVFSTIFRVFGLSPPGRRTLLSTLSFLLLSTDKLEPAGVFPSVFGLFSFWGT